MIGQAVAKFEYVRFDGENVRECARFAGKVWFHNNPKYDEKQYYGIKVSDKETTMLCTGDYLVKDHFGNVELHSVRTFFQKYNVVPKRVKTTSDDLNRWVESGDPFAEVISNIKQSSNSDRKHLSEGTIENLIQSNLERKPDGYSMNSLSSMMLGRDGRGQ